MDIDDLKTEHEAARILGLSVRTLQQKRVHGSEDLPYVKLGRSVRYRASDLVAFVEANVVRSTKEADRCEDVAQ